MSVCFGHYHRHIQTNLRYLWINARAFHLLLNGISFDYSGKPGTPHLPLKISILDSKQLVYTPLILSLLLLSSPKRMMIGLLLPLLPAQ